MTTRHSADDATWKEPAEPKVPEKAPCNEEEEEAESSKKSWIYYAVGGGVILLVVFLAGGYYYKNCSTKEETGPSAEGQATGSLLQEQPLRAQEAVRVSVDPKALGRARKPETSEPEAGAQVASGEPEADLHVADSELEASAHAAVGEPEAGRTDGSPSTSTDVRAEPSASAFSQPPAPESEPKPRAEGKQPVPQAADQPLLAAPLVDPSSKPGIAKDLTVDKVQNMLLLAVGKKDEKTIGQILDAYPQICPKFGGSGDDGFLADGIFPLILQFKGINRDFFDELISLIGERLANNWDPAIRAYKKLIEWLKKLDEQKFEELVNEQEEDCATPLEKLAMKTLVKDGVLIDGGEKYLTEFLQLERLNKNVRKAIIIKCQEGGEFILSTEQLKEFYAKLKELKKKYGLKIIRQLKKSSI